MLNRSARLAMLTSVLKALPGELDIKDTHLVFSLFSLSWQALRCQQAFTKPCLVKDIHLVFSWGGGITTYK